MFTIYNSMINLIPVFVIFICISLVVMFSPPRKPREQCFESKVVIKTAPSGPECPFLNQCCSLSNCSMYVYLYLYFMYTYTYTIIAGARLVPLTFTITTAEMATVMSGQECRSPFMTKDVASVLAKNVISRKTWILQNSFDCFWNCFLEFRVNFFVA